MPQTHAVSYTITISRQLGSGGAYLGRTLASDLGIAYADREILERAAAALQVEARDVESRDESAPSLLENVLASFVYGLPEGSALTQELPSYAALQAAESAVICEIATRQSAVIVGRAGYHLLSQHPRHLSVFLHASLEFRAHRVEQAFGVSRDNALRLIEDSDRTRGRSLLELTGRPWTDVHQYDICLCTSTFGLMQAARLLVESVKLHFRQGC